MSDRSPHRQEARRAEVYARLATVTDPELDEPLTELGFVEDVTLGSDRTVAIGFRLPTYWCAANFAFLMADDMRRAVSTLPWVKSVRPELRDHMYADEVNRGVTQGLDFGAAFGDLASDEPLDALRAKFWRKSFERRQEVVLAALLAQSIEPARIVTLTIGGLESMQLSSPDWARAKARYVARRHELSDGGAYQAAAFVDADGRPLATNELAARMTALRGVRLNMEFNSALCRGLLAARYQEGPPAGEPTLADFMPGGALAPR
ncbi:MAG: iron-sulfur cluster assembly protein [Alphaproteobacteria bacterium]|nr:iron-sulfur cluster assembly protein [Alphaproteobacteria bacterium]